MSKTTKEPKPYRNIGVPIEVADEMRKYSDASGVRLRKLSELAWRAFISLPQDDRLQLIGDTAETQVAGQ